MRVEEVNDIRMTYEENHICDGIIIFYCFIILLIFRNSFISKYL